jgi:hypothetical protein
VAKELFAKRKAKFYESIKTSLEGQEEELTAVVVAVGENEMSKSDDSNSPKNLVAENDHNYGVQLDDPKQTRFENLGECAFLNSVVDVEIIQKQQQTNLTTNNETSECCCQETTFVN